jgi:hypothetical protein
VIAASLVARLAYWQVTQRDRLSGSLRPDEGQRDPNRRGDIFDGTVVRHDRPRRLAAMPGVRRSAVGGGRELSGSSGSAAITPIG